MSKLSLLTSMAALSMCAMPVCATIVKVNYTGVVLGGHDQSGIFVDPDGDLIGLHFNARYLFDTNIGTSFVSSNRKTISGGSYSFTQSPSIKTTISIGNKHINILGHYNSVMSVYSDETRSIQLHDSKDYMYDGIIEDHVNLLMLVGSSANSIPFTLSGPFKYKPAASDISQGQFHSYRWDTETGIYERDTIAEMRITEVSVAPVPEPASWALLLVGFGVIGAKMRRRAFRSPDDRCQGSNRHVERVKCGGSKQG